MILSRIKRQLQHILSSCAVPNVLCHTVRDIVHMMARQLQHIMSSCAMPEVMCHTVRDIVYIMDRHLQNIISSCAVPRVLCHAVRYIVHMARHLQHITSIRIGPGVGCHSVRDIVHNRSRQLQGRCMTSCVQGWSVRMPSKVQELSVTVYRQPSHGQVWSMLSVCRIASPVQSAECE